MSIRPSALLFSLLLTSTAVAQDVQVDADSDVDDVDAEVDAEVGAEVGAEVEVAPPVIHAQPAPIAPPVIQAQPPQTQAVELERPPAHEPYRPAPIRPIPRPEEVRRPRRIRYVAGQPIPPGGRLVERRRIGMLIAGPAMFAVSYAGAVALVREYDDLRLAIPIIGPFLTARSAFPIEAVFLGFDGVIQLAGVTLLVIGLTTKKRHIQMYASDDGRRTLSLTPFAGQTNGLALDLTF